MQVKDVLRANIEAKLTDCLEEGENFDIAYRAPNLGDDDVGIVAGELADACLLYTSDAADE